MSYFILGFFAGLSLILAIGAQNIFVIEQGLKKQFVFIVCAICTFSDFLLIFLGIFLFHYFESFFSHFVELILNILLLLFLIHFLWKKIKSINTNFEINLRLGGQAFSNSVSHRYRQTYKHFSSNQCMEYSKTFYLSRSDAGSSSANVTKNIDITFTSNTTDKYFLFTNAITSTSNPGNYTTTNVHYPSISIEPVT